MAEGQGNAVSKVLGGVIGIASQGNIILAGIVQGIALYRQAREAWKAAHPDGPKEGEENPNWLEDNQLIDLLMQDSVKLSAHAAELLLKYAAAPAPAPEG